MLCAARASGWAPPSLRRAQRKEHSSTVVPYSKGGPFCAPIGGPVWTPIDSSEADRAQGPHANRLCRAYRSDLLFAATKQFGPI